MNKQQNPYKQQQNINTQKQSINIYCSKHTQEVITNLCVSEGCVMPLCPECIVHHNNYHNKKNQKSQIESIKKVKAKQIKIIQNAIAQMNEQLDYIDSDLQNQSNSLQENYDENIQIIRQQKSKLLSIISEYFENFEAQYIQIVLESTTQKKQNEFQQKLECIVQELEQLDQELQCKGNQIQLIKKINSINFDQMVNSNYQELQNLIQHKNKQYNISLNNIKFDIIEKEIFQSIQIIEEESLNTSTQSFHEKFQHSTYPQLHHLTIQQQQNEINQLDKIEIDYGDYFLKTCQYKYFHFFSNDYGRSLHIFDLLSDQYQFKEIQLQIDFDINKYHSSIITPSGEIYLIGGIDKQKIPQNDVYIYQQNQQNLQKVSQMITARSNLSVCYFNRYIYIIGGLTDQKQVSSKCERYNIVHNKWQSIADLNQGVFNSSLSTFNDQYLFKYGGILNNSIKCEQIEKYDNLADDWTVINVKYLNLNHKIEYNLQSSYCCAQINESEILIMGMNSEKYCQTFIYTKDDQYDDNNFLIKQMNINPVKFEKGLMNNIQMIYKNHFLALQSKNKDQKIIDFDGVNWNHF